MAAVTNANLALRARTLLVAAAFVAAAALGCGARHSSAPVTPIASPSAEDAPPIPSRSEPRRASDLERGLLAMDNGRMREAIAWFDEAIAADPRDADAFGNRAIAHLAVSEPNRALADAARAAELSPGATTGLNLAAMQVRLGLFSEAEPSLRQLASDPAVGPAARQLLAVALAETDHADEAIRVLEGLIAEFGASADTLNDLGVALERDGQPEVALTYYDRAIGADPEFIEAWRNLGMAHLRAGDEDNAERALERYLLLAPFDSIDRAVVQGRLDRLRGQ